MQGAISVVSYRAWFLILLTLTFACSFVDRIIISVVGQAIKVEMNLTDLQLGLLGGLAFAVFYSVLGIPISRLAERYSRVTLISIAIAAWSLMTALCGTAGNYSQLLIYRLGVGVGEAGGTPAAHSLISDEFPPERRATAFSIYALGAPLGVFIGALGGGWVAQQFGWRVAFFVMGLPGLLVALLTFMTLREPKRAESARTEGSADGSVPGFLAVVRTLLGDRSAVQMVAAYMVGSFALYGINLFIPIYFSRAFTMSSAHAGLLFAIVIGIAGMIGNATGSLITDRLAARNRKWYGLIPALGTVVGAPIMAFAFLQHDWPVAVVLLFIGSVIQSFFYGPIFSVVQAAVSPRMRARASASVLLLIALVGQGLGPTFVGFLSDRFTESAFRIGEFRAMCAPSSLTNSGHNPTATLSADLHHACSAASATGIRYAMLSMTIALVWAALHYYLASRSLRNAKSR
jgi:MFS family permease